MNGWMLSSSVCAMATAIGVTTSTVATLEMNWPSTIVSTHSTSSARCGDVEPMMPSTRSATRSAAPVAMKAADSGIMPAMRMTVVHEIDR